MPDGHCLFQALAPALTCVMLVLGSSGQFVPHMPMMRSFALPGGVGDTGGISSRPVRVLGRRLHVHRPSRRHCRSPRRLRRRSL